MERNEICEHNVEQRAEGLCGRAGSWLIFIPPYFTAANYSLIKACFFRSSAVTRRAVVRIGALSPL